MTQPNPAVQYQGVGAVSADQFNTNVQSVVNYTQLRTFTGLNDMTVVALGTTSENDGGQAIFYFSAASTAADNNSTVIAPTGSATGRWLRLGSTL